MFDSRFLIVGFTVTLLSLLLGMLGEFKELLSSWLFILLYVFFMSIIGMWVGMLFEKYVGEDDNARKSRKR